MCFIAVNTKKVQRRFYVTDGYIDRYVIYTTRRIIIVDSHGCRYIYYVFKLGHSSWKTKGGKPQIIEWERNCVSWGRTVGWKYGEEKAEEKEKRGSIPLFVQRSRHSPQISCSNGSEELFIQQHVVSQRSGLLKDRQTRPSIWQNKKYKIQKFSIQNYCSIKIRLLKLITRSIKMILQG